MKVPARIPRRASARGAAYVEVLVIAGIVVVLGLLAATVLGNGSADQAQKEAGCIKSFGCNEGAAGATGAQDLVTMVGNPSQTAAPPAAVAAPVPVDPRVALNNASNRLADAEDRLAAIDAQLSAVVSQVVPDIMGLAFSMPDPALTAQYDALRAQRDVANQERRAAEAAYDAIGQGILDQAYGGHYGFWQRNLIDLQHTPSFVVGLAAGTPTGVWESITGIGSLAAAGYDYVTGNGPPPVDPAVQAARERAARIAERQEYIDHELLRIRDGAAANYQDGQYDGRVVLGGVVLGEGVGLAVRGGLVGVQAVRGAEAVAAAPRAEELLAGAAAAGRAVTGGVIRADLEGSVANMFNAGPNRWTRLPTSPQGEVFTRGVSGDYAVGAGGTGESMAWLRGAPSDVPRHVSTPGSEANVGRFIEETNRSYADPLMLQGRSPALFDNTGRMASLPTGTTIDSVQAIGMFPNTSAPIEWTNSYLRMRSSAQQAGLVLDPASRGSQFAADLQGAIQTTARWGENDFGRFMTNQGEVEAALREVFARYP